MIPMIHCRGQRIPIAVVAAASLSILAAGCGGGNDSPGVATAASSTTTAASAQNGLVAYSRCMRSNGVTNFPDPRIVGGRALKLVVQQVGARNPHFEAAQTACKHLLPNGGDQSQETAQQKRTRLADELSFARCMRSHGVPRFPDPSSQGELTVEMVQAQRIDVHSPQVLHVVQTCLPASHGGLTAARVAEAINNASH